MGTVGITASAGTPAAVLANIERAESLGIPAAWLTAGGLAVDAMAVFAAAAVRTQNILLGTCIVPTWPRHPLALAGQAITIDALAPGRFRLGVGPSHKPGMVGIWGVDFTKPLSHLREYLTVLNGALGEGKVDYDGERYRVHADVGAASHVPVMISALQTGSFRLAGEMSDGAITWVTPLRYVLETAMPAMQEGAVGRDVPPVILHVPIAVHEDADEAREAARTQLAFYPKMPFYQRMLVAAGFPEAAEGAWSDAMIDAVVLHGDEASIAAKLDAMFAAGIGEVIAMPLAPGSDRAAATNRAWEFVGQYSRR